MPKWADFGAFLLATTVLACSAERPRPSPPPPAVAPEPELLEFIDAWSPEEREAMESMSKKADSNGRSNDLTPKGAPRAR